MRSMRLFYSNPECTSGQMVIASPDSHYKILHFHHGGLDKLAQLFEQWTAIKAKSVKDGSPSPLPDRHLLICQPAVSKSELDPEDGLYDMVSWDLWKSYKNADGTIDDSNTIRKAIFFASMEPSLRKEIWPFLLRVYPWQSTIEQRETIRNDLFLGYQNLRRKAQKKSTGSSKQNWISIENTIVKDVIRTDRRNPFYSGDDNPNVETMKNILLHYAAAYPLVNYIQGMSDLLAPLLSTIRNETDTYWCFAGLMQHTVFSSSPRGNENLMEMNLACWARYRTSYFHLFVCVSIISIYGNDVIVQQLPHDEILLYFSSLAMHMDARLVLKKIDGLNNYLLAFIKNDLYREVL
uniref:Rab-GAP TBC domain-containing protein n=1 Tax=Heterorhabditis bacteriophora TaxID=37862 RepID=A0A1I7WB83_HETBA